MWKCIIILLKKKILQQKIEMRLIKINKQVANLFTKDLSTSKLESFWRQLNVVKRMTINIEKEF